MAKGDLYRAVRRTGGLDPVVELFANMQKQRQKEQELKDVMTAFEEAKTRMSGIKQAPAMPALTNVKGSGGQIPGSQPAYNEAQGAVNDFLSSLLDKSTVDANRLNLLGGILRQQAQKFAPKPHKYQAVSPTEDIVDMLSGNTIRKGTPKQNLINAGGSFFINKGEDTDWLHPLYTVPKDPYKAGNYLFGRDSNNRVITDNPIAEFSDTPPPPNVAGDMGNIEEIVSKLANLKKARDVPARMDVLFNDGEPTDTLYVKNVPDKGPTEFTDKNEVNMEIDNMINNLNAEKKGEIETAIEKISRKIKGFDTAIDRITKRVGNDPSRVDPEVEKWLKSVPSNIRKWAKKIIKARIL